ncbi:xanthine dehydrogenase family protein molybdopterin-binding subunit [Fictibacillus terranigra]|uniref:Xanthine dehydrogenase family protein molybdopterin-binding subunit n=1 Tax=Fictibacillus terranigra TaxID=3058424 RepID=A0ABT8E3I8_9BACL|nr:xanthine dehydrogenase family protein molybdopterin-binding subunit [Fictibacillus sp. CENA-BCM004]MDN4072446.1 xanthine dehydrogenase family protein molybdopterin-binding subunit [Fictibacillus sp. CENA-BCM004]
MDYIGKSVIRQEAWDKVSGKAKYTADDSSPGILHAKLVVSPYAHARIKSIKTEKASHVFGVRAVLAGERFPLTGEEIRDRPPLATERVRYHGEAVALVVADTPHLAKKAADLIEIEYEPLPVVNNPTEALKKDAPLVHEQLGTYQKEERVYPVPGTNIANQTKIRKGNMEKGWAESEVTVEEYFSFSPSDHAAMETRCSMCEIRSNGDVVITSSSQAPFMIKRLIHEYFEVDIGKVIVETPFVGGGYGGKASIQLELLAYLACKAAGGRKVKLLNSREEDILTSPVHIGLDARVRLGSTEEGEIKAAELLFLFDGGAYSDKAADLSKAAAADCTGPYDIDNVWCNSLCMYTNHPYAAPFRGFSHSELLFAIERTMDSLAEKLGMDRLLLRYKNAIKPGDTTPTQVPLNKSNVGNLPACIRRLKEIIDWDEGVAKDIGNNKIRAKGVSCIWKTSTIESDAGSGVILTFNPDGSINLMSGIIEIGTGTKTVLAQILAERMKMEISQIHVQMEVNTQSTPEHWKTVASRGTFLAGRAVLEAAEDVIRQLKNIASCVLRAKASDLTVAFGKVFLRDDPSIGIDVKDIAYGYTFPNGNAIGGQIIGRGHYNLRHLTHMNKETGAGKPGPEWSVGAQAVEVEFDKRDLTYRIIRAVSVVDIGTVLNEMAAKGQVMGAMSMGLSFGSRETFKFDEFGRVMNSQLRTYRPIRYSEHPDYVVDFVVTPQVDAAYGARGAGEHGILGMPAALGNALSIAAGVKLNELPLTPELIWRVKKKEGFSDAFI